MSEQSQNSAAVALLAHIKTLTPEDLDRLQIDYIDYHPDAHLSIALFHEVEPTKSTNFFDLISPFTHELIRIAEDDDVDAIDAFCLRLFSALLRFEFSERNF